jgi:hypothetical protein
LVTVLEAIVEFNDFVRIITGEVVVAIIDEAEEKF